MHQPEYILSNRTRIRTHKELDDTRGMLIAARHLEARQTDAVGEICGVVPGHGGDVYWVTHTLGLKDGEKSPTPAAAYCFTEFELEP